MQNEWMKLRDKLLFKTEPDHFEKEMENVRKEWQIRFEVGSQDQKLQTIELVKELTIDMKSYLPNWHLLKDGTKVTKDTMDYESSKNIRILNEWGAVDAVNYIAKEISDMDKSSLIKLSEMSDNGKINTRWGNDYATGLTHALRRGAVLVTTNPPLIDVARKSNPEMWNPVRDRLKAENPMMKTEKLCSLMTMQVVLENCREIRPIYDATLGKYGYVSLQVNPKNYTDSQGMIDEAESLYVQLKEELGGIPNVVFKVPATKAGIEVVERLTAQGIGVNVTVNFTVSQELVFAEAIEKGNAKTSFLTLMSGRLDDPIRDELLKAGIEDAVEVSKWGGIAVGRRVYDLVYRQKDFKKSFLLQASLRGPWHIDELVTDEEHTVFITVFPDKAQEYDKVSRDIRPRISEDIPAEMLRKLYKSKIFTQAYEPNGLSTDDFDNYFPVAVTLKAFGKAYDELLEYLI